MLLRVILAAGAAALIAFAVSRGGDRRACDTARSDAFAVGMGRTPRSEAVAIGDRIVLHCRGAEAVVAGAGAFLRAGAVDPAVALAGVAIEREPDRRDSWIALARGLERQGDSARAGRALDRARSLDPRGLGR